MQFYESTIGWVQPLASATAPQGGALYLPEDPAITVTWTYREAGYGNDLVMYQADNANGRIVISENEYYDPDDEGYAEAAASRAALTLSSPNCASPANLDKQNTLPSPDSDSVVVDANTYWFFYVVQGKYTTGLANDPAGVDQGEQGLVVSTTAVTVLENSTEQFTVKLNAKPASDVTVNIDRQSGDTSLTATSSLTFTSTNWNTPQAVTVSAAEDGDTTNGIAYFTVSSTDLTSKTVTATEADNDANNLVVSSTAVTVPEAGSAEFKVKLSKAPTGNVTVSIAKQSGDVNLSGSPSTLTTFTTENWNDWQTVTLSATDDSDQINGTASFRVYASGYSDKYVTATEQENDWPYKWFMFTDANVDGYAHFQEIESGQAGYVAGKTSYRVEDLSNSGSYPNPIGFTNDADFNDVRFSVETSPYLALSGDDAVDRGEQYTLTLDSVIDPDVGDAVTGYTIHWGDGTDSSGSWDGTSPIQVQHPYTTGLVSRTITVDLTCNNNDPIAYAVASKNVVVTTALTWDPNGEQQGVGGTDNWMAANAWVDASTSTRYTWNGDLIGGKAVFSGTAGTVTVGSPVSTAGIAFDTSGYTISGGTVTLAWAENSSSQPDIAVTSGTAAISSVLAGSVGLEKSGSGILLLDGTNTYTGQTTVSVGTLIAANSQALGNIATGTTVASGAALAMQDGITITGETLTLNGTGISNGGALQNLSGNNTYAGPITLASASRINSADGTLTLGNAGAFTGYGALTIGGRGNVVIDRVLDTSVTALYKDEIGTLTLNAANTYTGLTRIYAGTLAYGVNDAIYTGPVDVYGGTLALGSHTDTVGTVTLYDGSITGTAESLLTTTGSFEMCQGTVSARLGGNAPLNKTSGNSEWSVTLSGANTYTGLTTVSVGTLIVANALALGDTAAGTTVASGAALAMQGGVTVAGEALTLNGTGVSADGVLKNLSGNNTFGGAITLASASRINSDDGTLTIGGAGTFTGYGVLTIGGSGDIALDHVLSTNVSGVTKDGSGTLTFNAANTYTGSTTVSAGMLAYGVNNAIYTGAVTVSGGTLALGEHTDTVGAVTLASGSITGTTGVLTGASYAVESGEISAILSGSGVTLTKTTAGTVILEGANTYTGNTTITEGTLAYGVNDAIYTGAVIVNCNVDYSTAVLSLGGYTDTISQITLNNSAYLSTSKITGTSEGLLTVTNSVSLYEGTVSANIGGSAWVDKNGTGTATLSGNNTYTGITYISQGTLIAASNTALGSTAGGTTVVTLSTTNIPTLGLQGGITITGEALTLDGYAPDYKATLQNVSGDNTYGGDITFADNYTRIDSASGTLTLSDTGTITGSNYSLHKHGYGTLIIGINEIDVDVIVYDGTLATDGCPEVDGNLTFSEGSAYEVQLTDSNFNQMNVIGSVNLGGANLVVSSNRTYNAENRVLTIIINDGTDPVNGIFADLPESSLFVADGNKYRITYVYNSETGSWIGGNDVAIISLPPDVTIAAVDLMGAEEGQETASFQVTRTGSTTTSLVVYYEVSGGTASSGDYVALTGSVEIPVGFSRADIVITPVDDLLIEQDETVEVTLANDSGYCQPGPSVASVTIVDNEPRVSISATVGTAIEGSSNGQFTFYRTGNLDGDLVVHYVVSGTATSGDDYAPLGNTVTILSGESSAVLPVVAIDDVTVEPYETVTITLSSDPAYSLGQETATVTIADDDWSVVTLTMVQSPDEYGEKPGIYRVTRAGGVFESITINFTITGEAIAGVDYEETTGTILLPAGETTTYIVVYPVDDGVMENNESLIVTLTGGSEYVLVAPGAGQVNSRIYDGTMYEWHFNGGSVSGESLGFDEDNQQAMGLEIAEGPVGGNTVTMSSQRGQYDRQPMDVYGGYMRLPSADAYIVGLEYYLYTWDSSIWDDYVVGISNQPCDGTAPVSGQFFWGGMSWTDGVLESLTGQSTNVWSGSSNDVNYLNVCLDTKFYGCNDTLFPSWGTITAWVGTVDVDTDSDNNNEAGEPAHSEAEEKIEDGSPGKFIAVQRNPQDGTRDVPLDIKLDSMIYGPGTNPHVMFVGDGGLTIRKSDGTPLSYNTSYSASELGLGDNWTRLYVEASTVGTHTVELKLDPLNNGTWVHGDRVTFTAGDQKLATSCSYNVGADGSMNVNDFDVDGGRSAYLILTGNAVAVYRKGCCGEEVLIFDFVNGSLTPRSNPEWQGTMSKEGGNYVLTDPDGTKWTFSGSGSTLGKLLRVKEPGDDDPVRYYDGNGWLIQEVTDVGSDGAQEIADYVRDPVTGLVTEKTVSLFDGSTTEVVSVTQYSYYANNEWGGNRHDLKLVTVRDGSDTGPIVDQNYYRYWSLVDPKPGAVKYIFRGASFARLSEALEAEGKEPFTVSNAEVAPYADDYYEYNTSGQVVKHVTQGSGCSLCTGLGDVTYQYTTASSSITDAVDHWRYKKVETASGTTTTTYYNYRQQVLLSDVWNGKTGADAQHWYTYYQYGNDGNLVLTAQPSAVIGYSDASDDLAVSLRTDVGLIEVSEYYASTTAPEYNESSPPAQGGGVIGYLWRSGVKQGTSGTTIWQTEVDYVAKTVNSHTSYFTYNSTDFADNAGSDPQTTSYRYRFFVGTTGPTIHTQETILPIVGTSEHGSGQATSNIDVFDTFGRMIWSKDAAGYITYTEYDRTTGALVKQIADVDLTCTGDFTTENFALLSSLGWSTPADGGKHLIAAMVVDSQGRTTKQTDPDGTITYTVYDDANHESRTYRGWNATTHQPTGPVEVYREDREGNYTESLTFIWDDANGLPVDAQGRPTGTESLTNSNAVIQSLSRSLMNSAGQATQSRQYFSLDGISYSTDRDLGVEGVNYLETDSTFDPRGRLAVMESPDGTVQQTFFDTLSRTTAAWVGTDDVPTTDYNSDGIIDLRDFRSWVSSNPTATQGPTGTSMYKVSASIYDLGMAGGDSNLTESRSYFGSGTGDYYATFNQYDWRNRLASATDALIKQESSQWATSVIDYSTQRGASDWSAAQTLSVPNVSTYGDNTLAWAPSSQDGTTEYVTLGYAKPIFADSVTIRENYGNGFVTKVELRNAWNNTYETVWQETDSSQPGSVVDFVVSFAERSYLVDAVRITVNTSHSSGTWEEVDAVQLHGWTGPDAPGHIITQYSYDNLGNTTQVLTYADADGDYYVYPGDHTVVANPESAELRAKSENLYDDQGRVYETRAYKVDPTTGSVSDYLASKAWYNSRGFVAKAATANGLFSKSAYDSVGRQIASYTCFDTGEVDTDYAEAMSIADDKVIEQNQIWYDQVGQVVASANYQRLPDDTSTVGALDATNSYTTASVNWYDAVGRVLYTADYGREDADSGLTHYIFDGATGELIDADENGIPDEADGTPREPNTSDNYIVTKTIYDPSLSEDGPIVRTVDNASRIAETQFDLLGRTIRTIQNYDNGTVEETDTDKDATTEYEYDSSGRLATLIAVNAKGDDSNPSNENVELQKTKYLYGSIVNASWQTAVVYPDSTDTLSQDSNGVWSITTGDDHTSTVYDLMGRVTGATDQRGVVHQYAFDLAGRLSADTATSLGSSGIVDGSVRRIGTSYDDLGRVQYVTSYSDTSGTTAANQMKYEYNGWGKVYREYEEHGGTVDANSLYVQYDYADGASGGVAKYVRLDEVTYPNGREVHYDYGTTGAIDDIMSRLATIGDGTNIHASYKYLGAGKIVVEDYENIDVKLDYAANNFAGFDRFGRVADQVWTDYGADPDVVLDEYTYLYDRAGNRTSRTNETKLDGSLDETYTYDDLDQLASWSLDGTLQKSWANLDGMGNDLDAGDYSAANEMTPNGQSGDLYDAAGNMTTLQSEMTAKYDAWNRLVQVNDGETIVQKNEYDGTNRRVQIFSDFTGATPDKVVDDYHVRQQVIEEDVTVGGNRDGGYQTIWSPRYIDAPILRDTMNTAGTGIVAAERVFYLADANYNVTGLVKYNSGSSDWEVVERYTYTPYGEVTYRNANWTTAGSSANNNTTLYTGRTLDLLTSLYYYRARYYDAVLERFISRDPIGFLIGNNLYEYVGRSPLTQTDPTGQIPIPTDQSYALARDLMWHWFFGNNQRFVGHSEGLKADPWIRLAVKNELEDLKIKLCKNVTNSKSSGMEKIIIKPGPASWWLIQTTNVPSEGLTMWVNYTVDTRKCCCKVDFSVNYRWLDLADIHPNKHWPDNWMQYLPADGEFWIDIQWTSRATSQSPLLGGACEIKKEGWPYEKEK